MTADPRIAVSVIVPTYNERHNVARLVERIGRALGGLCYEIIFVDDSTDGTDRVIEEQTRRDPRVALIHRDQRNGLATAVVDGMRRAAGEILAVLDADLQHPPEALPLLLEAARQTGADVVIGSRHVAGGGAQAFALPRRMGSRLAAGAARLLLSRARVVSDPMSGFFAVRRNVVEGVPLRPLGYKILLEILVRGRFSRVAEVPYLFGPRHAGDSKLTPRQQREYLQHLVRLVRARPDDLRFARFCAVGAGGAAVNTAILWLLTRAGAHYLAAGIAATACATTTNFLLNDTFTWGERRSPTLRVLAVRYLRYWIVTGTGSAVQLLLLFGLTTAGLPYLLSNTAGIAVAAVWNFFTNGRWTWKPESAQITRAVYTRRSAGAAAPALSSGGAEG
jgi:dolichol-phosphate mannosyltransferase